jgi:hypothetical protein
MKIVTASNGKKTVKISKREWQSIGKTAGWLDDFGDEDNDIYGDEGDLESGLEKAMGSGEGWSRFKKYIGFTSWDDVIEAGVGNPTDEEEEKIMSMDLYGKAITEENIKSLETGVSSSGSGFSLTYAGIDGKDEIPFTSKEEMSKYIQERLGADLRNVRPDSFGTDYATYYLNGATMKDLGIDINRFRID